MKKTLLVLLGALVVLTLAALPLGAGWLGEALRTPLPLAEQRPLEVPRGSHLSAVVNRLAADGLLGDGLHQRRVRWALRLYLKQQPDAARIHAGEYRLTPGMSLQQLIAALNRGDVVQRALTFVEGSTFRDWRRQLASADGLRQDSAALSDAELMAALERPGQHPEGWFAPDTYFYTRGDSDLALLRRALARQQQLLDNAWASRAEGLPYASPYEALIMASIVERETGIPSERADIAAVFVRRLQRGMRLQTDPTVIYGMGERYDGRIRRADLREFTPYNTYQIAGLPPTPIAMPGAAAIVATLNPSDRKALYFVARGDGSHEFTNSLRDHEQAVRRFQLNRRDDYRSSPAPAEVSP